MAEVEPDGSDIGELLSWFIQQRRSWSDEQILAELEALPVLPDEDEVYDSNAKAWRDVMLFVALADHAAERRLRPAAALLIERACYGDPGETMRGLRHSLEAIFDPDWDDLVDVCIEAAASPQRGARLWAICELGVLRGERARRVLTDALRDPADEVRREAKRSLEMLDAARS